MEVKKVPNLSLTLFSFGKHKQSMGNLVLLWSWLEPFLDWFLNAFNVHILNKHRINADLLRKIFDELDAYWLKNSESKAYSEADARLIIMLFLQSIEDGELDRKELLSLTDFIQRKWAPEIALGKTLSHTEEVIEARIEATVDQAVQLYEKTNMEKLLTPEEFIASTAEIIHHEPDGSAAQALLGGMMEIRNKLIY